MKMTVNEMMEKGAALRKAGGQFTLMGIGPMSLACIEATLTLARDRDFPVMLIASRNQVDSDCFGHGYVRNWDQTRFINDTKAVAERIGFDGLVYFCRDHGGPWQRDEERAGRLPVGEAMDIALKSYLDDMKSGFDLLHIDPTKDPHIDGYIPLEIVLERTVELIESIEAERVKLGFPPISYEVGTEETSGGLTSEAAFEDFIIKLLGRLTEKGLPMPAFIVGQTGTLTRLTENVGKFSYDYAARLSSIADSQGVGLKEHNSDYLRDAILTAHPSLGVTASNIAPEFGVVETRAYLEMAETEINLIDPEKRSSLIKTMREEAVKCERWRKWMVGETQNISVGDALEDNNLCTLITDICGHYTFDTPAVQRELERLKANLGEKGIDVGKYAVRKIYDSLDRYAFAFNLYGLTERLERI